MIRERDQDRPKNCGPNARFSGVSPVFKGCWWTPHNTQTNWKGHFFKWFKILFLHCDGWKCAIIKCFDINNYLWEQNCIEINQIPLIMKREENVKYSIMWLLTRNYYLCFHVIHSITVYCVWCNYLKICCNILRFKGKALGLLVLREGSLWSFSFKGRICKTNLLALRERFLSSFYYECTLLHTSCFSFKGKIQPFVGLLVLREGLLTNVWFERILFNSLLVLRER